LGLIGVWMAFPIAEIFTLIIAVFYSIKVYKEEIRYFDCDSMTPN